MSKRDLAKDLFNSYKTDYIKKSKPIREVNLNPTDPQLISDVLKHLIPINMFMGKFPTNEMIDFYKL